MTPEDRLAQLGLSVPEVAAPVAAYVPAVRTGSYVYTSGQLPLRDYDLVRTGQVGADVRASIGRTARWVASRAAVTRSRTCAHGGGGASGSGARMSAPSPPAVRGRWGPTSALRRRPSAPGSAL